MKSYVITKLQMPIAVSSRRFKLFSLFVFAPAAFDKYLPKMAIAAKKKSCFVTMWTSCTGTFGEAMSNKHTE